MDEVFTIGRFLQICILACAILILTYTYYFRIFTKNKENVILRYMVLLLAQAVVILLLLSSATAVLAYKLYLCK